MSYLLTIFGNPVSHSFSPIIHTHFASQFDLEIQYTKTETKLHGLAEVLKQFETQGGIGANVTYPLKREAALECRDLSDWAIGAQAVNTLCWRDGAWWGTNTDGEGFVLDLKRAIDKPLSDLKILVIGAGSTASSIIAALVLEQPFSLSVANRTEAKAKVLAKKHKGVECVAWESLSTIQEPFDIVINATSASLQNTLLPLSTDAIKKALVYDLVYKHQGVSCFLSWANEFGARKTRDGIGMLIEQAALSFFDWFKEKPNTEHIHEWLRSRHL